MNSYAKKCLVSFTVVLLVGCGQSGPTAVEFKAAFVKQMQEVNAEFAKTLQDNIEVVDIQRGATLTSNGSHDIPTGTKLYPIRVTIRGPGGNSTAGFLSYKNVYNEWKLIDE